MSLAASDLVIANLALNHLGQPNIAALDTTTENGRKMSAVYSLAVAEVLRDVRPNWAKKRAIFHQVVDAEKTITGATAADPVVITSVAHGFSTGDIIAIYDVGGMTDLNGLMYEVTVLTSSTFSLADINGHNIDGTDFDAFTTGGKCGIVSDAPAYGFAYRYAAPTDFVFLLEINGDEADTLNHSMEKDNEILTDETELQAKYIFLQTDTTKYDSDFILLVSYKLASLAAISITTLSTLKKTWEDEYQNNKAKAKGAKSQESGSKSGPQSTPIVTAWTNARRSE